MVIVQINATCGVGSTGKICVEISRLLSERGDENYILYSLGSSTCPFGIRCSDSGYTRLQSIKAKIFGNYGFNSSFSTKKMIAELERIKPDIVHIHNIHSHNCDLSALFSYLKQSGTKVLWTFHDCWAFTGYCTHFVSSSCEKWKTGCAHCPQRGQYSWLFDRSSELYDRKRRSVNGLDLTIATPSRWTADLVGESFLSGFPVEVINNGVNLEVFKPVKSTFRERFGLENKKILLGVSFDWGDRKGLDVFLKLAEQLNDGYAVVLVGTNDTVKKKLPANIVAIEKTENQQALAEIYSAADVFVNPTREDTFPTVNMEALACGTPVITFRTGGSPEIIDETCGASVPCDDVEALKAEIVRACAQSPFSEEGCVRRAGLFDKNEKFKEYIELYERIISSRTEEYRV